MVEAVKTVGRYEILESVGRGGMAVVYLARQTDLDRVVALKELAGFHGADPSLAQRFLRESRLAGSLSHPNIVTVHEYFVHDGTPYIAMEYVETGSLRPFVRSMTTAQTFGALEGLLAGLAHAEQRDVVHRDLKPENLMVASDGRVKIADFGIAKTTNQVKSATFVTATGTTVGTPAYMAPEQAMAQEIGPWTDLYSVGCMAFEMLVGRLPFSDTEAPMALLLRHVNEAPPSPRSVRPDLDPALSEWVDRLLVKDPTERTRSAAHAWDQLEDIAIALLGPRWRRQARMLESSDARTVRPLTPAPFEAPDVAAGTGDFVSYVPGGAAQADPAPESEPEAAPEPEARLIPPSEPEAVPEPEARTTPPPEAEAVLESAPHPTPPTPPEPDPPAFEPPPAEARDGFVTYGRFPGEEIASDGEPAPDEQEPEQEPPSVPEPDPVVAGSLAASVAQRSPPAAEEPQTPSGEEPASTIMPAALPTPTPTPAPAPARTSEERSPSRRTRWLLASLGVLVLLGAVAAALAGSSDDEKPPAARSPVTGRLAAAGAQLRIPASWTRLQDVPAVSELALADGVAVAPGGRAEAGALIVGHTAVTNPALLPKAFAATAGRPVDVPGPAVRLGPGGVRAYRYTGLKARGVERTMTLYAVPTTDGAISVACLAGASSAADWSRTCDRVATTLRLPSGVAVPTGPDPAFAAAVKRGLASLNGAVKAPALALRSARTRTQQADAAQAIARAHTRAAATLADVQARPADRSLSAALLGALRRTARVFVAASAAGRSGDEARWAAARRQTPAAESGLKAARRSFARAGYAEIALPAVSLPALRAARKSSKSSTKKPGQTTTGGSQSGGQSPSTTSPSPSSPSTSSPRTPSPTSTPAPRAPAPTPKPQRPSQDGGVVGGGDS